MLWQTSRRASRQKFRSYHRGPARSITFEELLRCYGHEGRRQRPRRLKVQATAPAAALQSRAPRS